MLKLFHPEHGNALRTFYPDDSENHSQLLEGLATMLEANVLQNSASYDLKKKGISDARKQLFESGVSRMLFPVSLRGLELPFGVYSLAMELIGSADAPTAMSVGIHNTVADGIYQFGSDEQRKTILVDLIEGKKLAAFALTEPSSGSDARKMQTKAVKKGSNYLINGSKMFITNAGEADLYFVFTSTEKGHAAFIVEKTNSGLHAGDDIPKLGMRGSRTAEVRFTDCEVSEDNLVGQDGKAFEYAKSMLSGSRIIMGSICVGIARIALEKAVNYSAQRKLFDRTLSDFQLTKEKIANMRTDINAARMLCLYAAKLKEMGVDYASEAAQGKVLATESAARVCDQAIQILGGYGYTNDDIHRHWRDARLLTIGEGTSEVLRLLIAGKELEAQKK
ncbi:MAG: acyl-CoA dehydrogenase family protein [Nitrososphaerales archaeon]|jgi:alkylation response protein AidB-like acyl-CoA dehydrogenase